MIAARFLTSQSQRQTHHMQTFHSIEKIGRFFSQFGSDKIIKKTFKSQIVILSNLSDQLKRI